MRIARPTFGALVATTLLVLPLTALAARLTTGALYRGDSQEVVLCYATNVGTKPVASVTASNIDTSGNVVSTVTCAPLDPGSVCQSASETASHCRIDFDGPRDSIRGSGSVNSLTGNNIVVVEPAR